MRPTFARDRRLGHQMSTTTQPREHPSQPAQCVFCKAPCWVRGVVVHDIGRDRSPARPLLVSGVKLSAIVLAFVGLFQAAPALAASADIGVTKSGPATVAPNANVTYTITYANNGPDGASNVNMTDSLPPGEAFVDANFFGSPPATACGIGSTISCSTSSMPSGSGVGLTVTASVASGVADGTVLSNTASVSSSTADPNSANNSSTTRTTVIFPRADLSVTKTGPATAAPDTNITYTITYANNGPATASNVNMSDPLPPGETLVDANFFGSPPPTACGLGSTISCSTSSMSNGSSVGLTVTTHIGSGLADGAVLNNTASVSSSADEVDPNSANNSSTTRTTVIFPRADLSVTKTGPATAAPDTNITYTITYANNGPATASNVNMSDPLPPGETLVDANFFGSPPPTACGLGSTISCSTSSMSNGSGVGLTVTTHVGATS